MPKIVKISVAELRKIIKEEVESSYGKVSKEKFLIIEQGTLARLAGKAGQVAGKAGQVVKNVIGGIANAITGKPAPGVAAQAPAAQPKQAAPAPAAQPAAKDTKQAAQPKAGEGIDPGEITPEEIELGNKMLGAMKNYQKGEQDAHAALSKVWEDPKIKGIFDKGTQDYIDRTFNKPVDPNQQTIISNLDQEIKAASKAKPAAGTAQAAGTAPAKK